jgi:hypothetical protein
MIRHFVALLIVFALHQKSCQASSPSVHYANAFQNWIAPGATWPCRSSSTSSTSTGSSSIASLSSSLGMEINCDYDDDIVVAAYSGTVHRIISEDSLILLRHSFGESTSSSSSQRVNFHEEATSTTHTWYTLYKNVVVDQDVTLLLVGDSVSSGQRLGRTSSSSSLLEFQVMVGASCTLEWARAHPLDDCNRKGYDPTAHPLVLFPNNNNNNNNNLEDDDNNNNVNNGNSMMISMDVQLPVNADLEQHGVVVIKMTRPTLTKFVVELIGAKDGGSSSTTTTTILQLSKEQVGSLQKIGDHEWSLPLVVPYTWLASATAAAAAGNHKNDDRHHGVRLSAYDIYGELVGQELVG